MFLFCHRFSVVQISLVIALFWYWCHHVVFPSQEVLSWRTLCLVALSIASERVLPLLSARWQKVAIVVLWCGEVLHRPQEPLCLHIIMHLVNCAPVYAQPTTVYRSVFAGNCGGECYICIRVHSLCVL